MIYARKSESIHRFEAPYISNVICRHLKKKVQYVCIYTPEKFQHEFKYRKKFIYGIGAGYG